MARLSLLLSAALFAWPASPVQALDGDAAAGVYARLATGLRGAGHPHLSSAVRGSAVARDPDARLPRSRAILGLRLPLVRGLDLFAEGRASLGLLPAGELSALFERELSPSLAGMAGLRFSF